MRCVQVSNVSLVNYLSHAGQAINAKDFVHKLAQHVPQHKDTLMTIAEQLKQEGMEQGIERGMEKGRYAGLIEVARTMLNNGLDQDFILKMTGLTTDELARIEH